jgi:hypothetical protein
MVSAIRFTLGVIVEEVEILGVVGTMVTTSVTTFGWVMPHVRVGLVAVWTIIGKAIKEPTGIEGFVVVAGT